MPVSKDQAQHWMKSAKWDATTKSLELQIRDQPPALLHDETQPNAKQLHLAISRAFPKPVNWNKILACTQKLSELLL